MTAKLRLVESACQADPSKDEARQAAIALLEIGARLLQEGLPMEAIPYLELARSIEATRVLALINLGGAHILAGRHRLAIPVLEEARDAEPDNVMIWTNLGAAYLGNPVLATAEQQVRAIEAFGRALELDPAAPNVHYNLGLIYVDRKEIDLARSAFEGALRVNPLDEDARLWLSRLDAAPPADERRQP